MPRRSAVRTVLAGAEVCARSLEARYLSPDGTGNWRPDGAGTGHLLGGCREGGLVLG